MGRCKECKKRGSIGGSAITPYFCVECGEGHFWSNTNHPLLCPDCMKKAQAEGRCIWCGKPIEKDKNKPVVRHVK